MCVQLYWGAKSELGEVVTRLSEVYEAAKRDAVKRLQQVGIETVAIGNGDISTARGQLIDLLPSSTSSCSHVSITHSVVCLCHLYMYYVWQGNLRNY